MRYQIQKGLVLEQVCGVYLLIATLEARKHCPYLAQLNEDSAFIWKLLQEKDTDNMIDSIMSEYELSAENARTMLSAFLKELEDKHYIIRTAE